MNLLFDFRVDKGTNTIYITREFAADLDLVWDAFTKAEILDQWFAPKPLSLETKEMDFHVGGRWLYAMVSPEGVRLGYSLVEFIKIEPKTNFSTKNTFSDENGKPTIEGFSITKNSFRPGHEVTTVYVEKKFDNLATLEMVVTMGFKEGTAAAMANLDEYFQSAVAN
ncbi:MAG: ATPase [Bacteroidetes bacterium]|nr:MAG: ATPase [Bacteroidota bacterium]